MTAEVLSSHCARLGKSRLPYCPNQCKRDRTALVWVELCHRKTRIQVAGAPCGWSTSMTMSLSNFGPDVLDTGLEAFISQSKKRSCTKVTWLVTGSGKTCWKACKTADFACRLETLILLFWSAPNASLAMPMRPQKSSSASPLRIWTVTSLVLSVPS